MPQKRKLGTPDSLSGLRSQAIQVALVMPLPQRVRKLTNDCAGVDLSSVTHPSVLLFCFTEGVSCSSVPEGECQ